MARRRIDHPPAGRAERAAHGRARPGPRRRHPRALPRVRPEGHGRRVRTPPSLSSVSRNVVGSPTAARLAQSHLARHNSGLPALRRGASTGPVNLRAVQVRNKFPAPPHHSAEVAELSLTSLPRPDDPSIQLCRKQCERLIQPPAPGHSHPRACAAASIALLSRLLRDRDVRVYRAAGTGSACCAHVARACRTTAFSV